MHVIIIMNNKEHGVGLWISRVSDIILFIDLWICIPQDSTVNVTKYILIIAIISNDTAMWLRGRTLTSSEI